jgi:fatty-acyl-CoA synthase
LTGHRQPILRESLVHGSTTPPLLEETLGEHFQRQTTIYGNKQLLNVKHQRVRVTWNEMMYRAKALARGLQKHGYGVGDRLGVWMPNNLEWVIAHWASALSGIVLVNLNPAYRVHEIEHALRLVGCKGIIVTPTFKNSNYLEMMRKIVPDLGLPSSGSVVHSMSLPLQHVIVVDAIDGTDTVHVPGTLRFDDLLSSPSDTNDDFMASRTCVNVICTIGID